MRPPYSSYHASTRVWNAALPSASLVVPSSSSCRSMTFCVAMAAWSVPGHHSTSKPRIRRCRRRVSWMENVDACPMCSAPVMLGGGSAMTNAGLVLVTSACPTPSSCQRSRHLGSTLDQSKCFSIGRLSIWADRVLLARRDGRAGLRVAPFGGEWRAVVDELRGRGGQLTGRRALAHRGKGHGSARSLCGDIRDGSEVGAPTAADIKRDEPDEARPVAGRVPGGERHHHSGRLAGGGGGDLHGLQRYRTVEIRAHHGRGALTDLGERIRVGGVE